MDPDDGSPSRASEATFQTPTRVVSILAAAAFLLEMAVSARYGYHRDELYFIASARHLAFGYVDQPPITPMIAGVGNSLFHGSLVGLRIFPALAMAALVVLSAKIAAALGANRIAQGYAALSVALTGEYLAGAHLVGPTIFDWLIWAIASLVLIRLIKSGDQRLWLVLGLVLGIGLENKWNAAFFGAAMVLALALTPQRRLLRSGWAFAGGAITLAIWAPNLAWQAAHGWPQFQVFSSLSHDALHNRGVYLPAQIFYTSVVLTPVWIGGLVWLLRNPQAAPYRALGLMFLVVVTVFLALGGKPYYPGGMYTLMFAAGSIPTERYLHERGVPKLALVVSFALLLPIALPVLPAKTLAKVPLQKINYDLAETIGWPKFVSTVAGVYGALPRADRANTVILTQNYGEAGAIDRYGSTFGLPPAYSGHNNYWLWGPPRGTSSVTIAVNIDPPLLASFFTQVKQVATFDNGIGVQNDEQGAQIYLCTGQRQPWAQIWPAFRSYG
jgi:4-amino-4-deoxy-L-arabinose transferase-like glycosyltransferase